MIWTFSLLGWFSFFSRMDELRKTVKVSDCGNDAQDFTVFDVLGVFDLKVPYYAKFKLFNSSIHL